MRLLLLRHGEAGYDAPSDELRPLTANGRLRLEAMLQSASGKLQTVGRIIHSPYLRTTQTAELVQSVCPLSLEISDRLTPEASPAQLLDWLQAQDGEQDLLLVTHQPLIGNLVSLLCEGDLSRPEPMLPGALAIIECDLPAAGLGRLLYLA